MEAASHSSLLLWRRIGCDGGDSGQSIYRSHQVGSSIPTNLKAFYMPAVTTSKDPDIGSSRWRRIQTRSGRYFGPTSVQFKSEINGTALDLRLYPSRRMMRCTRVIGWKIALSSVIRLFFQLRLLSVDPINSFCGH